MLRNRNRPPSRSFRQLTNWQVVLKSNNPLPKQLQQELLAKKFNSAPKFLGIICTSHFSVISSEPK
jgi:hypothetical protein